MKKIVQLTLVLTLLSAATWQCKRHDPNAYNDYYDAAGDLAKGSDIEDENWKYIEGPYIDNDYIERTTQGNCPETYWGGDTLFVHYGNGQGFCLAPSGRYHLGTVKAYHNGQAGPGLRINISVKDATGRPDNEPYAAVEFMRSIVTLQDTTRDSEGYPVTIFNRSGETSVKTGERITVYEQNLTLKAIRKNDGTYYEYTGEGSGQSGDLSFDFRISEPLIMTPSCTEIVKGKMDINFRDGVKAVIDFGNGECDGRIIIIIIGDEEKSVPLHETKIIYTHQQ